MHMYLNTMAVILDTNIGRIDALGFFLAKYQYQICYLPGCIRRLDFMWVPSI